MISKIHIVALKHWRRQLNAKVCGSKSAMLIVLSLLRPLRSNNDNSKTVSVLTVILAQTDTYHSAELYDYPEPSQLQIYSQ